MDPLEHRGLDLQVAAVQQPLAQGLDGGGAGAQDGAGVGAGDQVQVAAPDLGLGVGEPAPFVGQGVQALAGELPGGDEDGGFALVAEGGVAGDGDVVADVGVAGEAVECRAGAVAGEGDLVVAGPVAQHGEDDAAEVADQHDASGHGDVRAGGDVGEGVGRGGDAHGVGIGAGGAQPVEGAVPDTDLVGQARVRGRGPGPVPSGEAGHRHGRRACRGGGPPSVLRVPFSPEFAQRRDGDEAFGDGGGEADAGEGGGVAVADEARVPLGAVLGVGAVQGLQLPPAGEEQQQPAPQPQDRPGTDAGALLEDGPEDGEVQGDAAHAQFGSGGAQFGDHELHDPVGGGPVTAHQVQGHAVAAPGHEGEQREQPAVLAEGLHEQAVAVGGVAEPVQGHGEAALGLGVPPGVGLADDLLHLAFAEVRVATDAADGSGTADPVHGLPGDAHLAAGQVESRDVQDRLVTELEGAQAGAGTGAGAGLGGAHDGGRPGVPAGQVQPGVDGARPGLRVADGVPRGQAHPGLDAVGDGRLAAGREDDGLVAPGGEVAEGVPVAVRRQQGTDAGLLVAVQGGFQALGTEQRGGRVQQGEGAEQAEHEGHLARWAAVEGAARDQPAAHPVGGPGQVLAGRERAREEQEQAPAEQDRHGEPGSVSYTHL